MSITTFVPRLWLALHFLLIKLIITTRAAQVPLDISQSESIYKTKDFGVPTNCTEQHSAFHVPYVRSETDPVYGFNDQLAISWIARSQAKHFANLQCWKDSVFSQKTGETIDNTLWEVIETVPLSGEKMEFFTSLQRYRHYQSCRWLLEKPADNNDSNGGRVLTGNFHIDNVEGREGKKWSIEVSEVEEIEVLDNGSRGGMSVRRWKVAAEAGPTSTLGFDNSH